MIHVWLDPCTRLDFLRTTCEKSHKLVRACVICCFASGNVKKYRRKKSSVCICSIFFSALFFFAMLFIQVKHALGTTERLHEIKNENSRLKIRRETPSPMFESDFREKKFFSKIDCVKYDSNIYERVDIETVNSIRSSCVCGSGDIHGFSSSQIS